MFQISLCDQPKLIGSQCEKQIGLVISGHYSFSIFKPFKFHLPFNAFPINHQHYTFCYCKKSRCILRLYLTLTGIKISQDNRRNGRTIICSSFSCPIAYKHLQSSQAIDFKSLCKSKWFD